MDKKKLTAILATSTVAMNVTAAKTVLADTMNDQNLNSAVEDIKNHEAKSILPTLNGITVNKQLININYSKGVIIVPRYIVIHDTDNRRVGANAMANRNYFANHEEANASAHYTVDQGNIIQCLEDNWRGWHVGDGNNPLINNSNTIGIELCVNADNNFDKTLENGIALTKYLMQKYNIPAERVVRHYDVSRKICPKMMIQDNPGLWTYFKQVISGQSGTSGSTITEKLLYTGKVVNVNTTLNVRGSASGSSSVVGSIKKDSEVNIYGEENGWYKVAYSSYGETKYGYVSKNYISINSSSSDNGTSNSGSSGSGSTNNGTVDSGSSSNNSSTSAKKGKVVNVSTSLNVRNAASTSGSVISYLQNGQEVTVNYEENGWYNITFDTKKTGFVSKSYISVTSNSGSGDLPGSNSSSNSGESSNTGSSSNDSTAAVKKGKVVDVSTSLNVRSSASTNGSVVAQLKNGQEVTVNYEQNGWYNITFDTNRTGFVSKSYISITSSSGTVNGGSTSSGSNNSSSSNGSSSNNSPSTNTGSSSTNTSSVKKGKVVDVSTSLNVRKGAGTNYTVVTYLSNNTEVEILSEQGSWYKIRMKDGKEGYAAKQYINIISGNTSAGSNNSNESKGKVFNVSTNLNVRMGAGTGYSVVAYLLPGADVVIKNNINGWYYIEAKVNGSIKTGYVKTDYIKLI